MPIINSWPTRSGRVRPSSVAVTQSAGTLGEDGADGTAGDAADGGAEAGADDASAARCGAGSSPDRDTPRPAATTTTTAPPTHHCHLRAVLQFLIGAHA